MQILEAVVGSFYGAFQVLLACALPNGTPLWVSYALAVTPYLILIALIIRFSKRIAMVVLIVVIFLALVFAANYAAWQKIGSALFG
jgi:hypothetical protein